MSKLGGRDMEDIYKEPNRKAWLKAEINRHEYARKRLSEAKAWLMIPKAEPEDVDIYLDEFLCVEDINAISELIDSLIEKEIYRFEGALWRMENADR